MPFAKSAKATPTYFGSLTGALAHTDMGMINAASQSDLSKELASLDISVPRRSEGRTSDHTERYAIAFLISTLNENGYFDFPLSLSKRERPDFFLQSGANQIGIEHTEAVSQNEAQKSVLRDKIDCSDVHFISHALPGDPKRPVKTLIEEIATDEGGEGWHGDSVEKEWAAAMGYFANEKLSKIVKAGFDRFEQDWLVIYDNWSLPALKIEKGARYLSKLLDEGGVYKELKFVFILSGKHLCEFSSRERKIHNVVNLWSKS